MATIKKTLNNKIFLESSSSLFNQLHGLLIKSSNPLETKITKQKYCQEFYHLLYQDILSNEKYFIEKHIAKKLFAAKVSMNLDNSNETDFSVKNNLNTYSLFSSTKEMFIDKMTSQYLPNETRLKYSFDYYFYILEVFADYIYFCYENNINTETSKTQNNPNCTSQITCHNQCQIKESSGGVTSKLHNQRTIVKTPLVLGVQAIQASAKTTLCNILKHLLRIKYNLQVESFSSDDFYVPYCQLMALKSADANFKFRGPPGTHDVNLLLEVLENFKQRKVGYYIERFDKKLNNGIGNRIPHSKENLIHQPLDILIFEGWFNGIKPASKEELEAHLRVSSKDITQIEFDRVLGFQVKVSEYLKEYQRVWDYFDRFLIIKPFDYGYSRRWRMEAVRKYKIKDGLDEERLKDFINYSALAVPHAVYFDRMLEDDFNVKANSLMVNEVLKPLVINCDFERKYFV